MFRRLFLSMGCLGLLSLPMYLMAQQDSTSLAVPSKELETVVIKADPVRTKSDRVAFSIPEVARKKAANAMDLLTVLPGVAMNPETRKPEMMNGERFLILINGVQSDVSILRSMPAEEIKRLEILDMVPMRYREYDKVINVLTYGNFRGGSLAGDLVQSVSPMLGMSDAWLQGAAFGKKDMFAATYYFSRREYKERITDKEQSFTLPSIGKISRKSRLEDAFGYRLHLPTLTYQRQETGNYTLQLVSASSIIPDHAVGSGTINENGTELSTKSSSQSTKVKSSVDLLFIKEINKKNSLSFNAVWTGIFTDRTDTNHEEKISNKEVVFSDKVVQDLKKNSLILQADYAHTFESPTQLSLGYRYYGAKLNAVVTNSFFENKPSVTTQNNHSLYGDFAYKLGQVNLSLKGTLDYLHSNYYGARQSSLSPQVYLNAKYIIDKHNALRLRTSYTYYESQLGSHAENMRYLEQYILYRGNPNLKPTRSLGARITYSLTYPNLYVELAPIAHCNWGDEYNDYFLEKDPKTGREYLVSTPVNARYRRGYGTSYNLQYAPWMSDKGSLVFKTSGDVYNIRIDRGADRAAIQKWLVPLNYSVELNYGKWGIYYRGNLLRNGMDGLVVSSKENQSSLGLRYTTGPWTFRTDCLWFLTECEYLSHTVPQSLVQSRSRTHIRDDRSVIRLNVAFDFSWGKSRSVSTQKLNEDSDSGAF